MSDEEFEVPMAGFPVEEDDDWEEDIEPGTVLAQLQAELEEDVKKPDVTIAIPERKNIVLTIGVDIDRKNLKAWRVRAGEGKRKGMDSFEFACYVLAGTTKKISMGGHFVTDEDGKFLNFTSKVIQEMAGDATTAIEAVAWFFSIEPHVESAAVAILDAAGYGDEVEVEDPSQG